MERTRAGTDDLQPGVIAICVCCEFQRKSRVLRMKSWDRDLLSASRTCAPHKTEFHSRARRSSQIDASDIRPFPSHCQAGLLDTVQACRFQLYLRRMLTHESMRLIHSDEVVGTYGPPLLVLHPLT